MADGFHRRSTTSKWFKIDTLVCGFDPRTKKDLAHGIECNAALASMRLKDWRPVLPSLSGATLAAPGSESICLFQRS